MLEITGYLVLFLRLCVAVDNAKKLPLNEMTAFTFAGRSLRGRMLHKHSVLLSTKQKNPLLGRRWDASLSQHNIIEDNGKETLSSAGVDVNGDGNDATDRGVNEYAKKIAYTIIRPPAKNKAPQCSPEAPPHTALAQVLANQYGIDITSVSPSARVPGSKITAEDVEYHAWKISQPPCTAEALELGHSLDLDLNDLYDDEDREYVLQLSDVELFRENESSLKMVSQTNKGLNENLTQSSRKRMKKIDALDKRMEQNVVKLAEKAIALAGTVTGGIVQQFQSQTQMMQLMAGEKLGETGVFVKMNGKMDINAVEDFDSDLASEIEEALSSANIESGNAVEPVGSSAGLNDDLTGDMQTVENSGATFASDIQDEFPVTDFRDSTSVGPIASNKKEDLQSMTVVELKEELRRLEMKVSGRKADLVERLLAAKAVDDEDRDNTNNKSDRALFFAAIR